jgi:hypothetical protein
MRAEQLHEAGAAPAEERRGGASDNGDCSVTMCAAQWHVDKPDNRMMQLGVKR